MNKRDLRIEVEWNDDKAEFLYSLAEKINGVERYKFSDKDIDWATRIAEHYGLELPSASKVLKDFNG